MNTAKKRTSVITGLLFVLAVALLLFSTVGGARAALTESTTVTARLHTMNTGVTVALSGPTQTGETIKPGMNYAETVTPTNTSNIETYMRVDLYKYWLGADGSKSTTLDPSLIKLVYNTNNWTVQEADNGETVIAYYKGTVAAGATVEPLVTGLSVDGSIIKMVYEDGGKLVFLYDGAKIQIDVQASVVQTHNASDAMLSAWGITSIPG